MSETKMTDIEQQDRIETRATRVLGVRYPGMEHA